jgi:guanylate kinase
MSKRGQGRLVVLSGPSCVGKSPLDKAMGRLYPDLRGQLTPVVLYNDRAPRPGEEDGVDYHFRTREQIERLRECDHMVVMEVRGDLQALDLDELADTLDAGDAFFEGNPFVGSTLLTHPGLADVPVLSVFMSPLSRAEILFLREPERNVSLEALVTDVMRRKLLRRTQRQKGALSLPDLEEIERRSGSAYSELKKAHLFEFVIANHDGEDSDNWDAFPYPLGDARSALETFVAVLRGEAAPLAEIWEEDLLAQ